MSVLFIIEIVPLDLVRRLRRSHQAQKHLCPVAQQGVVEMVNTMGS